MMMGAAASGRSHPARLPPVRFVLSRRRLRPTRLAARRPLRLERLEDRAVPATWDGGGANNLWSNPQNWIGDFAPFNNEDLTFPAGAAQPVNVNDLPAGFALGRIEFDGPGYQVSGNPLTLQGGLR